MKRAKFPRLAGLPFQPPLPPMEAKLVRALPTGDWQWEPKWDGFRCLAFRDGDTVVLQSKSCEPLTRYFPELVADLLRSKSKRFVIDGEIVISDPSGQFSFDALLQRIHPAQSRIDKLAVSTPARLLVFDLLVDAKGRSLRGDSLQKRREALEKFIVAQGKTLLRVTLSPATRERKIAQKWWRGIAGIDGVMAKQPGAAYASGERTAMEKCKHERSAECVVGGFRWAGETKQVGSLLLGLYDDEGALHHVGFAASFPASLKRELTRKLVPLRHAPGFTGRAPGGPSRWSTARSAKWEPVRPEIVVEVHYDHVSGERFRHGTRFLRLRPEKSPKQCTFAQLHR